jgi:hypothetical protein
MATTSAPHEEIFKEVADAVGTPPYSMLEVDSVGRTFKRDAFHSGNLQRINHDHHNSGNNTHGGTNAYQGTVSFPNLTAGSMLELNANKEVVATSGFSSANLMRLNVDSSVSGDNSYTGTSTHTGDIIVQTGTLNASSGLFVIAGGSAPSASTDAGVEGQIAWDGGYMYVCVPDPQGQQGATVWMRSALSAF